MSFIKQYKKCKQTIQSVLYGLQLIFNDVAITRGRQVVITLLAGLSQRVNHDIVPFNEICASHIDTHICRYDIIVVVSTTKIDSSGLIGPLWHDLWIIWKVRQLYLSVCR